MINLKLVGAVAIAASALSSPALAQAIFSNPDACEAEFASANCMNTGAGSPLSPRAYRRYNRRAAYYGQPGYVAAGVAGAAIGTAAAVAATPFNVDTAPYRGWHNSYAMYGQPVMYGGGMYGGGIYGENGWYGDWNTYAARNGITCRPGTLVKLDDGRQYLCQ